MTHVVIEIFDSLEDGTARLSAHTAFDDPTTPADAAPRQSIELRALVFWRVERIHDNAALTATCSSAASCV